MSLSSVISHFAIAESSANVRFIGTSDLHGFIKSYDYYLEAESEQYGLEGISAEIDFYRKGVPNSFLADVGDTLVGSPMGDYYAANFNVNQDNPSPVTCALNALNFDIVTLGNHEFDYGIPFLQSSYQTAQFPIVSTNVMKRGTDETLYAPFVILEKEITLENGATEMLKVGFISATPMQTMDLNRDHLEEFVEFKDPLESIQKAIKNIKAQDVDLIVLLSHSGQSSADINYSVGMENATNHYANENEIDVILMGHTHKIFSTGQDNSSFSNIPTAQPGKWGEAIAIVDLKIQKKNQKWEVISSNGYTVPQNEREESDELQRLTDACTQQIDAKITQDLNQVVTNTTKPFTNHFNLLGNDPIYTLMNESQLSFLKSQTQIDNNVKLLSSAAPAVSFHDPSYFIDIPKGPVTHRQILPAIYPATLAALEMSGAEIKEWLEITASIYAQQKNDGDNSLLVKNAMTFLYYPISGISYEINLDKKPLYNQFGNALAGLGHEGDGRIESLEYQGLPIDPEDKFILIASSYAPYFAREMKKGRDFINIGAPNNKDVFLQYLAKEQSLDINVQPNWQLKSQINNPIQLQLPTTYRYLPNEVSQLYEIVPTPSQIEGSLIEIYFK